MPRETLLQSQKNQVFSAIVVAGMHPSEFEWRDLESSFLSGVTISALVHKPSSYWFRFDRKSEGGWVIYSPGEETRTEDHRSLTWASRLVYVRRWLVYLQREVRAPDLWSALASGPALNVSSSNDSFTPTELDTIDERLAQIERRIGEVKALQQGESQYVRESLEYLRTNAKRQGRRDWINLAIGVVFNLVVFLALPPEAAGALFRFAVEQIQGFGIALVGPRTPEFPVSGAADAPAGKAVD